MEGYQYAAEGRLTSVTGGGVNNTYVYDALGQRAEWGSIQYLHGPSGELQGHYLNGSWDGQTVMEAGHRWDYPAAGGLNVYHPDLIGSVKSVTSANGSVASDDLFYPFGQTWTPTGASGFAGFQDWDGNVGSGLYPAEFRLFAVSFGRWLTPDPAGLAAVDLTNPQSLNRYAYVGNNPTSFIDPLGLGTIDSSCTINPDGSVTCPPTSITVNGSDPPSITSNVPCALMEGYDCGYGPPLQDPYSNPNGGSSGGAGTGMGAPPARAPSKPKPPAANNGQQKTPKQQCIDNFLKNNYGNFVGGKVVPNFSFISIATNFWGYAKSSALTLAVKGGLITAPKALSWVATTTGNNLAAYPGMATASADALESGAFWGTTAATAEWVIAPVAVGATSFSTTADAYARWSCQNVQ